jgi:hypothetical protein
MHQKADMIFADKTGTTLRRDDVEFSTALPNQWPDHL